MEDDDPFSFITRQCYIPPHIEDLLDQLPYARENQVFADKQARASPSTAAAVNVPHARSIRIGENRSPQIPTPIEERFPNKQVRASPSTAAAVNVADAESSKAGENQSLQFRTPIEVPSPNKQVRVSTTEVGECSRKRNLEISKDVEIITIEDSDDEGEEEMDEVVGIAEDDGEEVQEVEIAEDAGAQRRRLLPSWGRMNQEAQDRLYSQKSKQREDGKISTKQREDDKISTKKRREDDKITLLALLEVLAREQVEARMKLGLDDDTTGDFLETVMRRGVKF